jgi:hypothetical protein
VSGPRPPRRNVTDERELRGHVARVLRVAIGVDRGLTAATSCRRCPSTSAAWSNPKFRDQDQGLTQQLARALGPQARTASRTEPLPRSHPTGPPARRTAHRFVVRPRRRRPHRTPDQNDAGASPTPSAIGASAIVGRSSVCTQIDRSGLGQISVKSTAHTSTRRGEMAAGWQTFVAVSGSPFWLPARPVCRS